MSIVTEDLTLGIRATYLWICGSVAGKKIQKKARDLRGWRRIEGGSAVVGMSM
jgi:hypothetical protein